MFKGTNQQILTQMADVERLKRQLQFATERSHYWVSGIEKELFESINKLAFLCSTEDTK